jgi:hypothetical protein
MGIDMPTDLDDLYVAEGSAAFSQRLSAVPPYERGSRQQGLWLRGWREAWLEKNRKDGFPPPSASGPPVEMVPNPQPRYAPAGRSLVVDAVSRRPSKPRDFSGKILSRLMVR